MRQLIASICERLLRDSTSKVEEALELTKGNVEYAKELNKKMENLLAQPPDAVDRLIRWHKEGLLTRKQKRQQRKREDG